MSDETSYADQLAALRARRAELAAVAESRVNETSPEAELALEQRALLEDEALDAAQRAHGATAVAMVRTELGAVILRRPHVAAYRKFTDAKDLDTDKFEELVKSCLIYPTRAELDKILRVLPGTLSEFANTAVTLAGFRKVELGKK